MTDFDARAREIACDWHDCPKGLYAKHSLGCDELASAISSALKEAVEGEREACAKIAEDWASQRDETDRMSDVEYGQYCGELDASKQISSAIRSRKETPDV